MTFVFVSCFYNHHQAPFARAMDEFTNHNFYFIETEPLSDERKKLGWGEKEIPSFVIQSYCSDDEKQRCKKLIADADVVIWGGCPMEMIRNRLKRKKLTFCYSERLFKRGFKGLEYWGRVVKYFTRLCPYQKNHYLLCASAYAAGDYARIGLFRGKAYRWGYFPEVKEHNIDALIEEKKSNSLLWAGRFLSWKQPQQAVEVAKRLRDDGVAFEMNIIGRGELDGTVKELVERYHLEENVHLTGSMKPEEVRKYMEQSEVYLFTSDQNEGWGAVLNESMNSGCIVVANEQIGSVPFLIRDGENGIVYAGSVDELYEKVKDILVNKKQYAHMGRWAYQTMVDTWNAKTAAQRLIRLAGTLNTEYTDGPTSPAT